MLFPEDHRKHHDVHTGTCSNFSPILLCMTNFLDTHQRLNITFCTISFKLLSLFDQIEQLVMIPYYWSWWYVRAVIYSNLTYNINLVFHNYSITTITRQCIRLQSLLLKKSGLYSKAQWVLYCMIQKNTRVSNYPRHRWLSSRSIWWC